MPNATVLVVDDEALIRWSLTERLKAEGYDVLEAETGRAALEQVRGGRRPGAARLSAARTRTACRSCAKIKEFDQDILVILLTAYASVETAVEAMKLGAYHFANKPFNLDEVAATGRARAGDDAAAPRGAAVPHERRPPLQPAAHRRRVGADDALCGIWSRGSPPARPRRCC